MSTLRYTLTLAKINTMKQIITLTTILMLLTTIVRGQAHLPEIITTSPVFIKHSNGTGTGFLIQDSMSVYFITARHNIFDINNGQLLSNKIELITYHSDPTVDDKNIIYINIKTAISQKMLFSKNAVDIIAIKIADIQPLDDGRSLISYDYRIIQKNKASYLSPLPIDMIDGYDDIYVGDEVFLFGYPTSIGLKQSPQFDFTRPLLRRGVVAGKYDKLKTIVLDCPSYPGNSGGPVIRKVTDGLSWEYTLIGLVVQFIPYEEQWINIKSGLVNTDRFNSGYSVALSGDKILELIK